MKKLLLLSSICLTLASCATTNYPITNVSMRADKPLTANMNNYTDKMAKLIQNDLQQKGWNIYSNNPSAHYDIVYNSEEIVDDNHTVDVVEDYAAAAAGPLASLGLMASGNVGDKTCTDQQIHYSVLITDRITHKEVFEMEDEGCVNTLHKTFLKAFSKFNR